jgi:hypothetical protein
MSPMQHLTPLEQILHSGDIFTQEKYIKTTNINYHTFTYIINSNFHCCCVENGGVIVEKWNASQMAS